ncbi:YwqG family protein [Streptomyces sp. I05A-00742]|uniref:YwqG family protein n=1 Tax=Streptomyces sp. I05A-00742 TaxID=2732853 RepID=UPI00289CF6B0|nr:YwqG family protein [Streptomyces sp. I05A-00742]
MPMHRGRVWEAAPWPTAGTLWPASEDGPLDLLAQPDLAEVARVWPDGPLPDHGLLSFFYDTEDQPWTLVSPNPGKWRVRWDHGEVLPLPPPEDWVTFTSRRIRFEAAMTLPSATEDDCVFQDLGLTAEPADVDDAVGGGPAFHQLLGWPHLLQGGMTTTCQRESGFVRDGLDRFAPGRILSREDWDELDAGTRAADWRLLLQLGSDAESGWCWGGGGGLYFWIRAEDLETARFDRVWAVMQC